MRLYHLIEDSHDHFEVSNYTNLCKPTPKVWLHHFLQTFTMQRRIVYNPTPDCFRWIVGDAYRRDVCAFGGSSCISFAGRFDTTGCSTIQASQGTSLQDLTRLVAGSCFGFAMTVPMLAKGRSSLSVDAMGKIAECTDVCCRMA